MSKRDRRRCVVVWALGVLCLAAWGGAARAAIGASATIQSAQLGPDSYEYSLTLTNTGTTPIGTFWYAWIPGYDLLPSAPTAIASPAGWTGINAPDFYGTASVQWVNTASPLQPGLSLSGFKFDTPDPPSAIGGISAFGLPVNYSYVYIGAPQTDPGAFLQPTTVTPEPGGLAFLALAGGIALGRRRPL
jgi:hypothetical protein